MLARSLRNKRLKENKFWVKEKNPAPSRTGTQRATQMLVIVVIGEGCLCPQPLAINAQSSD